MGKCGDLFWNLVFTGFYGAACVLALYDQFSDLVIAIGYLSDGDVLWAFMSIATIGLCNLARGVVLLTYYMAPHKVKVTVWPYNNGKPAASWPFPVFFFTVLSGLSPIVFLFFRLGILWECLPQSLQPWHHPEPKVHKRFQSKEQALLRLDDLMDRLDWMETVFEAFPQFVLQSYVLFVTGQGLSTMSAIEVTSILSSLTTIIRTTWKGNAIKYADAKDGEHKDVASEVSDVDRAWYERYNLGAAFGFPNVAVDVYATVVSIVIITVYYRALFFALYPGVVIGSVIVTIFVLIPYWMIQLRKRKLKVQPRLMRLGPWLCAAPFGYTIIAVVAPGYNLLSYQGPMYLGGRGLDLTKVELPAGSELEFGLINWRTIPGHLPFRLTFLAAVWVLVQQVTPGQLDFSGDNIVHSDLSYLITSVNFAIPIAIGLSLIASTEPCIPGVFDACFHRTLWCSRWDKDKEDKATTIKVSSKNPAGPQGVQLC